MKKVRDAAELTFPRFQATEFNLWQDQSLPEQASLYLCRLKELVLSMSTVDTHTHSQDNLISPALTLSVSQARWARVVRLIYNQNEIEETLQ